MLWTPLFQNDSGDSSKAVRIMADWSHAGQLVMPMECCGMWQVSGAGGPPQWLPGPVLPLVYTSAVDRGLTELYPGGERRGP